REREHRVVHGDEQHREHEYHEREPGSARPRLARDSRGAQRRGSAAAERRRLGGSTRAWLRRKPGHVVCFTSTPGRWHQKTAPITIPASRYSNALAGMLASMARPPAARSRALDAFARILVSHGERAATLEAVAETAEISKGGLLYHFGSKDELVAGLVERL